MPPEEKIAAIVQESHSGHGCIHDPAIWYNHPGMSEKLKDDLFSLFKTMRMQIRREKERARILEEFKNPFAKLMLGKQEEVEEE